MTGVWIIDTETTGAEAPEVIEFAHAPITAKAGPIFEMGDAVLERYKPSKPLQLGAMATHHIIPADLEDLPPPPESFALPRYVVGHNIDFDWKALGAPDGVKRIDTLALAREAWPGLDSYKLGALIYHLFPHAEAREMLRAAHSAAADILLCFAVFIRAMRALPGTIGSWGDVYALSEKCRIPKVMAFGKHQGTPIAEVPADYVAWYRRQPDPDPYLLRAFENAGL